MKFTSFSFPKGLWLVDLLPTFQRLFTLNRVKKLTLVAAKIIEPIFHLHAPLDKVETANCWYEPHP